MCQASSTSTSSNPPLRSKPRRVRGFSFMETKMTQDQIVRRALKVLEASARIADALASPAAVRSYLKLKLMGRPHEVFVCVFLDAQNRVIATEELFRGTLTQTSVYPREVVKEALAKN